jgi:hypothetical protein
MNFRLVPLILAAGLLLASCDSAGPGESVDELSPTLITSDAAEVVANAVGVAPGGLLNDLAETMLAAEIFGRGDGATAVANPGCSYERFWDEAIQRWVRSIACERGEADGPFYALFARTHHFGFYDASGEAQQMPGGAASMSVDLVDGEGVRRTPRMSHTLLDIGAAFVVDDLQSDLVTVNGTAHRAATDIVQTRERQRTLTYEISIEAIDVVGPRHGAVGPTPMPPPAGAPPMGPLHRRWAHAVGGTLTGEITGVMTVTTPAGTLEREFSRSFVITFGDGEGGTATIRFPATGETFAADLETGTLRR